MVPAAIQKLLNQSPLQLGIQNLDCRSIPLEPRPRPSLGRQIFAMLASPASASWLWARLVRVIINTAWHFGILTAGTQRRQGPVIPVLDGVKA